jgi:hypothetical protein
LVAAGVPVVPGDAVAGGGPDVAVAPPEPGVGDTVVPGGGDGVIVGTVCARAVCATSPSSVTPVTTSKRVAAILRVVSGGRRAIIGKFSLLYVSGIS